MRTTSTPRQRYAATALAARPIPQAKAEAWHSVVEKGDLPNAIQAAVIAGFSQPEQLELLEPYVQKYFDSLNTVWETRTYELAQQIVTGMYPYPRIQPDTLERTDRFLASTDPVPAQALRRLVLESRDGVARAMRARECDAAAAAAASTASTVE